MNQMAMINGGSTATKVAHVIGAIATPLATIVGGPLCGRGHHGRRLDKDASIEYNIINLQVDNLPVD